MKKKVFQGRVMRLYLLMCLLFSFGGVGMLSAQDVATVTVENLKVLGRTMTFDVSWTNSNRAELWSDTVWVFIDCYDPASTKMERLQVGSASVTAGTVTYNEGNTDPHYGFNIVGNARTTNSFTASATVTVPNDFVGNIVRPCVYASDFPPVITYNMDGSMTASFTGTQPYTVKFTGVAQTTTWPSEDVPMPLNGKDVEWFTDATGNKGVLLCTPDIMPTITNLEASASGTVCSGSSLTLTATTAGEKMAPFVYTWSRSGGSPSTGTANTHTYTVGTDPETYTLTVRNGYGCAASASVALNVYQQPTQPAIDGGNIHANDCSTDKTNTSVQLTASGSTHAVKYNWYAENEEGEVSLVAPGVGNIYNAGLKGTYNYTVKGVNACGEEGPASASYEVTIDLTLCLDQTCGTVNAGIIGSEACALIQGGSIGE